MVKTNFQFDAKLMIATENVRGEQIRSEVCLLPEFSENFEGAGGPYDFVVSFVVPFTYGHRRFINVGRILEDSEEKLSWLQMHDTEWTLERITLERYREIKKPENLDFDSLEKLTRWYLTNS